MANGIRLNQQGFNTVSVLLLVAMLVMVGFAGFRVYRTQYPKTSESGQKNKEPHEHVCGATTNDNINKTGVSEEFGFSIDLPSGWGMDRLYTQEVSGRDYTMGNIGPISTTDPNAPCAGNKSREVVNFKYQIVTSTQDVSQDIIASKISSNDEPRITSSDLVVNGLAVKQRIYNWVYQGFNNKQYKGEIRMNIYQANGRYYYLVLQAEPNQSTADPGFEQIARSFKVV